MKVVDGLPPNFNDIKRVFPDLDKNLDQVKPIFCYGDTIYNPFEAKMTPDLEVHEEVHSKQQGDFPEIWWVKFLSDKEFRFEQELEAYGTQYAFVKEHIKDAKLLAWAKEKMASALSGQLYGNMVSYGEAESKIRTFAKNL